MCGIAGVITENSDNINTIMLRAQDIQSHRGPDAQGIVVNSIQKWGIGLGHQRLSILDLSDSGNQPMIFAEGKGILVYNGEVYNYKEIQVELKSLGYSFKSDSDTEVILAALHEWGIEKAITKFNGMWAFAWLDTERGKLFLSRDRAGVKPLFYYIHENELYFSSEIKTILEMVPNKFSLNYKVIGEYLIQSLLASSTETFFKGISRVPAAHFCEIDLRSENININFKPYWSIPTTSDDLYSENDMIEKVRELFFDSVKLRMRSDVPIGVLLSGGVDSSSIASVMNNLLGKNANLNILSAVSSDRRFDESPFIDVMSNYLQKPVHKVNLEFKPQQAIDYLEKVCWFNDEPVGSFSNVAHYLLMKQAKDLGITVILSGQGADELLCGYKKYLGFYIQYLFCNKRYVEATKIISQFYFRGTVINQFSTSEAKRYLPSFFRPKELDVRGDSLQGFSSENVGLGIGRTVQDRQILDIQRFSVPVLTHYEDRMSMAWSREVRVPFLDYRLIETLVPLPIEMKLQNGWTKSIFRKAMEPYLPKEIVWRKDKQGFVNPQSEWLKNELKDKVVEHFSEDSLIYKYRLINRENLIKKYDEYCHQEVGKGGIWFKDIFNPLALEVWLRKFEKYISY